MLWDWLFIVTGNSCSNVFQDSFHGVCWMDNKDLNKCRLSTPAKNNLSEWVEAFSAHTYSFMVCLADVPTARMGKSAIFCLGLCAKCKLWVAVWHPFFLGNPHQLCYWHKCLQTPKMEVVWIFRGKKGGYLPYSSCGSSRLVIHMCCVSCLPSVLIRKLLLRFLLLNIGYTFSCNRKQGVQSECWASMAVCLKRIQSYIPGAYVESMLTRHLKGPRFNYSFDAQKDPPHHIKNTCQEALELLSSHRLNALDVND